MDDNRQKELRRELLKRELALRESQLKPQGLLEPDLADKELLQLKPPNLDSLGQSARHFVGGYGQGLANIGPGLLNLGVSGVNALGGNLSKIPMIDLVPHTPAATVGEIGSFFGAPGFLKAISKIQALASTAQHVVKIPMVADALKHASNVLGKSPTLEKIVQSPTTQKVAGNALLGGAYVPENPLLGMGLGAAGGAIGDGVGKLASDIWKTKSLTKGGMKTYNDAKNALSNNEFLNKAYANFNPASHAKELEHHLSVGANNVTENSRQLASEIRNAHNMREEEARAFYNYALKNAGHEPVYGVPHKDIFPSRSPEYAREQDTLNKIKNLNVGDLYHSYKANPNFENAHRLQSELGNIERKLNSNLSKSQDDYAQIKKIKDAKTQLQEDIQNGLEKRDINTNHPVAGHYKKGTELFREHVAPFSADPKLIDITKGGQTVVKNLHTVFDTPSNTITKDGLEKIGSINKIMHDLPETSKMRIIFDAIGGNKLSAKELYKKLEEIKSKGFESYFTPEVEKSINALGKKLRNKKYAVVAGGLVGAHEANKLVNVL